MGSFSTEPAGLPPFEVCFAQERTLPSGRAMSVAFGRTPVIQIPELVEQAPTGWRCR